MDLRWRIAILLLASSSGFGQSIVDVSRIPPEWRDLGIRGDDQKLACQVTTIKPRLNYSFRFQTGYVIQVPMRQYLGKGHSIVTFFRVTPDEDERDPVYFVSTVALPEVPKTNQVAEFGGGYVVGEGKYRVDMLVTDNSGRVCAQNWKITAKLGRKEDDVKPGMPAGAIDEISVRKWTRFAKKAGTEDGYRITVLMNASAVFPRKVRLAGYDRILLLSSLASLIERVPVRSMRLIIFSLDQQREIYRDDNFEPARFGRVARSLNELELGTVDYEVLKNRRGHIDLTADLIRESVHTGDSDAVIFLGPKPWYFDKVQRSLLPERGPQDPPFFYVQFRPYLSSASYPDTLMNAVKQIGGKTFDVYSPGDFAEAIRDITRALEEKRPVNPSGPELPH